MRTFASLVVFATLIAAPVGARALVVPINHSARVNLTGTAASVVVGNPAIADVTVVDSHTVYVLGREYGSTDLVVLDAGGRTLFSGDVIVSPLGGTVAIYRADSKSNAACNPGCTEITEKAAASTAAAASRTTTLTVTSAPAAAQPATDPAAPHP